MEKTKRVFQFLADAFVEPGEATAGRILAILKENPGYKKSLEDVSQEDLVDETFGEEAVYIARAIKEAVEEYHNVRLEENLAAFNLEE